MKNELHNSNPLCLITLELASQMPNLGANQVNREGALVYIHLFGVIGDWYLTEISSDQKVAYGYKNILAPEEWEMQEYIPNCSEWGEIPIEELQKKVNTDFMKDKDIRFLISRDLFWKPCNFSAISLDQPSLNYPGPQNRPRK